MEGIKNTTETYYSQWNVFHLPKISLMDYDEDIWTYIPARWPWRCVWPTCALTKSFELFTVRERERERRKERSYKSNHSSKNKTNIPTTVPTAAQPCKMLAKGPISCSTSLSMHFWIIAVIDLRYINDTFWLSRCVGWKRKIECFINSFLCVLARHPIPQQINSTFYFIQRKLNGEEI